MAPSCAALGMLACTQPCGLAVCLTSVFRIRSALLTSSVVSFRRCACLANFWESCDAEARSTPLARLC